MPPVTKSTTPTAFTDSRSLSRRRAPRCALALALGLSASTAQAQTPATRACIDAATHGQELRDAGKLRDARGAFLACAAPECPSLVRQDCATWLADVASETPSVVLGARDEHGRDLTRVRAFANDTLLSRALDGRPYSLDPGPYRFRFEREDGPPAFVDVVLRTREGARNVVVTFPAVTQAAVTAPERAAPSSGRAIAMSALGVGALAGAAGAVVFSLRARSEVGDLRASCSPACNGEQERALHADIFLANLSLGVGVVSLAALLGVALWPRATTRPAVPLAASVTLAPARAGIGGSLRMSF